MTREINKWIGSPENPEDWDKIEQLPPGPISEFKFWVDCLPRLAGKGRLMWKFTPAQLYELWLAGSELVAGVVIVDASIHGWGLSANTRQS
eukprot:2107857-Rhodomonas_salina.3